MASIRILIVDDQALFREGLRTLLSVQAGLEIVGEAGNGEEALRQAEALNPDVILMDLQMPFLDGAAATRRLKAQGAPAKVIVLTTFDDDENVFEGLRAGAVGYLLRTRLRRNWSRRSGWRRAGNPSSSLRWRPRWFRNSHASVRARPTRWPNRFPSARSKSCGWWRAEQATRRSPRNW